MSFLGAIFETKSAKSPPGAASRALAASASARGGTYAAVDGGADLERFVRDMERSIWIFRCVDAISGEAAGITMFHEGEDGKPKKNPKIHKLLNIRPNDYQDAQQFRYVLSGQSLLSRRGVFVEIVGEPTNPAELHILPPQFVEPIIRKPKYNLDGTEIIPPDNNIIDGYKVRGANFKEYELDLDHVMWIKAKPHLLDPLQASTAATPAALATELDYLARKFNITYLRNDGRPGLLVVVDSDLLPEDAEEIRRRFSGQYAGGTTVIEGAGLEVQDMSGKPRDAQWSEALSISKDDILLAFGVPESVLGRAAGRTFDNADAEYEIFWTMTMMRHCKAIASGLDRLTGDIHDSSKIAYDFTEVDVLQRHIRRNQDRLIQQVKDGVLTIDEYFEEVGKQVWNVPATRTLFLPNGLMITKDASDADAVNSLPRVSAPPQDPALAAQEGAQLGAEAGMSQLSSILYAREESMRDGRRLELVKGAEQKLITETKEGDAAPLARSSRRGSSTPR